MKCNGEYVDSEVIYWKVVPGDIDFESPITPRHDEHHERFLTFAYDEGGWYSPAHILSSLSIGIGTMFAWESSA